MARIASDPRRFGHNHDTLKDPETGKLYHEGCPVCEKNAQYIRRVTEPGITKEERERVDIWYRGYVN